MKGYAHKKVYVLAQNLKEAEGLRDSGCGYESRADAMKARSSPEIYSYYRNLLKVFEMDRPSAVELVETLWACACGFQWFGAPEIPDKCPSCGVAKSRE